MDCTTIIAVCAVVITFFSGYPVLCTLFVLFSVTSGVSAFHMRQFSTLQDLEKTADGLRETRIRLEGVAADLQRENNRLAQTNRELLQTNDAFRATNLSLQQTNTRLNTQVTQLTLQVTQLRETAERIKEEMLRFQRENSHLSANVRGFDQSLRVLDQQILSSRALCDQITSHLTAQQQSLGPQLEQLGRHLAELRQDNRVHERIRELVELQRQILTASGQLNTLRQEFATERGHIQGIHQALSALRGQFETTLNNAASSLQANNRQFRDNLDRMNAELRRVQTILNRS
ncbi:MAG: hypothetical protein HYX67_06880 [Candidatus Melainabacteria bacterium]|nr:hypothetical protein [Candidatus Melainabacteria bacterium]